MRDGAGIEYDVASYRVVAARRNCTDRLYASMVVITVISPRVRLNLVPGSVVVVGALSASRRVRRPISWTRVRRLICLIDTPRYALSVECEFESPSVRVWCGFEICQT